MLKILMTLATLLVLPVPLAAAPAPPAPPRLTTIVTGNGSDVILIPGLASSSTVWADTVAQLSPRHRVHVVQIAGFAGIPPGPNAQGPLVAPLTEALHSYIKANNLKSPAIIGHSMGGFLAMNLALEHPGDAGRLMIVDSLPFIGVMFAGPTATVAAITPQATGLRDRAITGGQASYAAAEPRVMARLIKSTGPAAQAAIKAASASDVGVVARAMYETMTTDLRPRLGELKLPVTMLYPWDASTGAPQAMFDGLYTSAYAGVPQAKVKRIDGSYHFIQIDQPAAFAKEVATFLGD